MNARKIVCSFSLFVAAMLLFRLVPRRPRLRQLRLRLHKHLLLHLLNQHNLPKRLRPRQWIARPIRICLPVRVRKPRPISRIA